MEFREVLIGRKGRDFVSILPGFADGEGWFDAVIHVRCDAFSGSFNASFMTGELSQFAEDLRQLQKDLRGAVVLDPVEPYLKMKFIGDGKGHIDVTGEACSTFPGACLQFEFEIDQTFLPAIIADLSANEAERARRK